MKIKLEFLRTKFNLFFGDLVTPIDERLCDNRYSFNYLSDRHFHNWNRKEITTWNENPLSPTFSLFSCIGIIIMDS